MIDRLGRKVVPTNEVQRLRALELYRVLDSETEAAFDNLTLLAASICETPIGLVSLVDERRQWFKARVGLEPQSTPRSQAFCAHAILDDDVMVVEDARADERFLANPLVTGEPRIRFYAGAPLTVGPDLRLGTLCVIDRVPRKLEPKQLESLEILRDSVVNLLELRRAQEDLDALQNLLPMCAWCRDVRVEEDGDSRWRKLHDYVIENVAVTHGICPSCKDSFLADGGSR